MKLASPSLPRSSYVSSSFGLYCSACLGILFVSILCMCCSHFSCYCFISFTIFSPLNSSILNVDPSTIDYVLRLACGGSATPHVKKRGYYSLTTKEAELPIKLCERENKHIQTKLDIVWKVGDHQNRTELQTSRRVTTRWKRNTKRMMGLIPLCRTFRF